MTTTRVVALFTPSARAAVMPRPSRPVRRMVGHGFHRDIIRRAVRYYVQLGAVAERIAGILADRGIDVSGLTIRRWVQKST
jgi:transposase-like protein